MILFCFINILILALLSMIYSNLSILLIGLIGLIIVVLVAKNSQEDIFNSLSIVFFVSVIFMLVLYFGYMAKYGAPYYIGGSDDLEFERNAKYIINQGYLLPHELMNESQFYYYSAKGFLWVLSWIIRFCGLVGGYHTIVYRILNIYFLMLLGILVHMYFSKHYKFTSKQNRIVFYAMTLFPNAQYITLHVFRDTLNILIIFVVFYIWDAYFTKNEVRRYVLIILVIFTMALSYVSYWMRAQNLIFICAILVFNIFLRNIILSKKNFGVFFTILVITLLLISYFDVTKEILKFNEFYSDYLLATNDGISQKIFSMNLFPFGILLRMIFGLISPIPVSVLQFTHMFNDIDVFFKVIISVGVIAQIYMIPYLFANIRSIDKIVISFIVFFLATVITTFTFRHFIMLYPFMVILIFRQYFVTSRRKKYTWFICMTILMILAAYIYIMIK